ncbi:MAG TPA: DUF932 domain-containing protein [Patescibacteria group bacterium]|nr:DUF932 domain-containing protein [Patescibacteria group bacterium]
MEGLLSHHNTELLSRSQLATIPAPEATDTFKPISHIDLVQSVLDGLSYRHINIVKDEYAVSEDGMKLFGILELEQGFDGARYSLGIRNANDKSMRLAMTVGFRVFVCDNMAFWGDFTPVLHKHTKNFNLMDAIAVGLDRMQRNFEPMRSQVLAWREAQLTDENAKLTIYRAFIEGDLDVPKHLARAVHSLYFEPQHQEFAPRTVWSLQNAFTSAFKELEPIPQFKATAKLGDFFARF